jgi:hypothetical protein
MPAAVAVASAVPRAPALTRLVSFGAVQVKVMKPDNVQWSGNQRFPPIGFIGEDSLPNPRLVINPLILSM